MTVVIAAIARDGGDAGRLVEQAVTRAGLWEALPADPARTDATAARVDIGRVISYMNDSLGGCVVPVATDDDGRVRWQAERNLYLPQPNHLAMFGGDVIDVCKLESVRHEPDRRRTTWRTVRSPNGSALYDDGSVTFAAADDGRRTTITVRVRQRFTLPLFWQVVDLDAWPELKAALVADAYRQFLPATMDNFEARYEGREFRIGRPPQRVPGPPTERLALLLDLAAQAAGTARERLSAPAEKVGDDGFAHFEAGTGHPRVSGSPVP
ncbi:hypothetical protein [Nonomuraea sp. NPDC050643]|uniref:hypothetical protein n=1 Tax=Nonomuraea sp. NPDC050643 TaxID=3155660 RepID=UPI0033EAC032